MTFQITRSGKNPLMLSTPVMPAAGTFGFGECYQDLINIERLGAIVTNPLTLEGWSPARGTRLVPLDAGMLMHTGLPNPGLRAAVRQYHPIWATSPVPIIVHLVATSASDLRRGAEMLDTIEAVVAVEIGLDDDITWEETENLVRAAAEVSEKPLLVRLPLLDAYEIAEAAAGAGADALVVAAPPRGTARDPHSGRLVSGRIYGPLVKPIALHMVGVLAKRIRDVPIIGAGGIHSMADARDFIEAGAVAVQLDAVTWIKPRLLERIARDLGGWLMTRASGSLPDEWHPDMGDTEFRSLFGEHDDDSQAQNRR